MNSDQYPQSFFKIISLLNTHDVRYVIIGEWRWCCKARLT